MSQTVRARNGFSDHGEHVYAFLHNAGAVSSNSPVAVVRCRPSAALRRSGGVLSSGAMSDLLRGAQEFREKLYRLEVLLEIEKGGKSRSWFGSKAPQDKERGAAIKRLTESGLIEAADLPADYRLTTEGWEFLRDVRAKVGGGAALDWTRSDEIDFSRL